MNIIDSLKNTSIQTKLVIPIIVFALTGMFLGTKIIEEALNKQIFGAQKSEIKNFSNKIYYILRSDYRTLFFEFAKDEDYYTKAKEATQKESINNLSQMLEGTGYLVYILNKQGKRVEIINELQSIQGFEDTKHLKDIAKERVTQYHDTFIYKFEFLPWDWTVVIIKDSSLFKKIISENKEMIFTTMSIIMFAILALLFIVINYIIQKPFKKVFEHLNKIKLNKNVKDLSINDTKETQLLSYHINSMNKAIKKRQKELKLQKRKNETILNSQTSLVIVSNGEMLRYANESFFEFFAQYNTIEEFVKEHACVCDFFEKIDKKGFIYKKEGVNWIEEIINTNKTAKVLMKDKHNNDTIFTIDAKKIGLGKDEYVINLNDITKLEKYKEQLSLQLHTDELTKLPNRLSLSEKLSKEQTVSLILLNINDFKEVNDFYGTQTGDKILYEYGRLLLQQTQDNPYTVYKLSGDEFALYIANPHSREGVIKFIQSLLKQLDDYNFYDLSNTRMINLTSTAGAVINVESPTAFVNADIALKTAKKRNKNFMTYRDSQATKDEFATNIEWANNLKKALLEDKIVPYFQPIYNNKTQKIEKYEALVRLIDSKNNPVSPFFFLDVAKKSHQYLQLTETMLDKTFDYFKDKEYGFSLNLSESDLVDFSINTMIIKKLQSHNIGNRVIFELVESENINDYSMVSHFIKEVKKYGAKVAIDDFGAGFSNFRHVSQLNVDYLKIDGSLIQNILIDKNSETIVEAIATFAKRLNIETIAEFVDSQEIQDKVIAMGIDYTQGYFIDKPKPAI